MCVTCVCAHVYVCDVCAMSVCIMYVVCAHVYMCDVCGMCVCAYLCVCMSVCVMCMVCGWVCMCVWVGVYVCRADDNMRCHFSFLRLYPIVLC